MSPRQLLPQLGKATGAAGKDFLGVNAGIAGGALAAPFLAEEVGAPIVSGLTGSAAASRNRQTVREGFARPSESLAQKMARLMEQNRNLMATMEPHLYAELIADRTLARGTRVYGAAKNPEAIQEVLLSMSRGTIGARS